MEKRYRLISQNPKKGTAMIIMDGHTFHIKKSGGDWYACVRRGPKVPPRNAAAATSVVKLDLPKTL